MSEASTDEALLGRYKHNGDVRAFELLVKRHRKALFNFIFRFVGEADKAEDLLQDVMVKMATRAADYEGRAKVRTWLFTIARNLAVDELRKARHRRAVSLDAPASQDDGMGPMVERVPGSMPSPDRAASAARLQPILKAAIAALPEDQREVFLLREYAGVPFKEIAKITGTGPNTVKSRMRYALEGLRRFLEETGIEAVEAEESNESAEAVGT